MKKNRIIIGNLGLLLSGVLLFFPAPAHATGPISFSDYSVTDTATTNGVQTNSQTLKGPPPNGPQSGTVTQNNPTSSAPSKSSITAGVNPTDNPVASTNISIAQTVTALGLAPLSSSSAFANSAFSADFKGTGNVANLYVNYFAGGVISAPHYSSNSPPLFPSFGSNLVLTVKNLTTNTLLGSLDVMGNAGKIGEAQVISYSGFSLFDQYNIGSPYTNGTSSTGPLFLYFATQSTDSYQISGDMSSVMYGNPSTGGTGLSTFDLVANTPEPSTWFLFGTGMILLGLMGHRNRKGLLTKV